MKLMMIKVATFGALAMGFSVAPAHADIFQITFEAPGVQNSTGTFTDKGVEDFDSLPTGSNQSFSTTFAGSDITGTYSGVTINGADQYGGAGGTGNYAVTFSSTGYSLGLSTTNPDGVNYFGYWLSALDAGNQVTISRGGTTLLTFNPTDVLTLVGSSGPYFGNPNNGQNSGEPYVFLNFFDTTGTFDKISFAESPAGGGYESDNHTVGFATGISGTPVPAVPELTTWAMLVLGLGFVGGGLRYANRSKQKLAVCYS